jgi:hypothetical protein
MEIARFADIGILRIESNKTLPSIRTSFREHYKPDYRLKNRKCGKCDDPAQ